ncbi:MAG: hypothetical protein ABI134_33650 [Byssovorax sp.]
MTPSPYTTDPTLAEPLELILEHGERCWTFPASWKDEEVRAFLALREEELVEDLLVEEQGRLALAPARIIEAKSKELARKRAARLAAERDAAEELIYQAAVKEHGGEHRVGRIRTPEGSILLRPQAPKEIDRLGIRLTADGMKDADQLLLVREALITTVVHPARAGFEAIVGLYPGLWKTLYEARDKLVDGRAEELGKKA